MNTTTHAPSVPPTIWVGIAGVAAAFVGAFLPWVTTPFGSVSGTQGDGLFILIGAAIVAAVFGIAAKRRALGRGMAIPVALVGALMAAISIYHVVTIRDELMGLGSPGIGLYMCAAGSLAIVGVALASVFRR
jgi:hypothetical protein